MKECSSRKVLLLVRMFGNHTPQKILPGGQQDQGHGVVLLDQGEGYQQASVSQGVLIGTKKWEYPSSSGSQKGVPIPNFLLAQKSYNLAKNGPNTLILLWERSLFVLSNTPTSFMLNVKCSFYFGSENPCKSSKDNLFYWIIYF